jgi:hypothetical protein
MALQVQENKICFMCEFWHLGGCEVSGMFFYCEIFKRHILFVVGIGLPLYCLFFNQRKNIIDENKDIYAVAGGARAGRMR